MIGYGNDIRVCTQFQQYCPKCNRITFSELIEKSELLSFVCIPFHFCREYHVHCYSCHNMFYISHENRKKIYMTFFEKIERYYMEKK